MQSACMRVIVVVHGQADRRVRDRRTKLNEIDGALPLPLAAR